MNAHSFFIWELHLPPSNRQKLQEEKNRLCDIGEGEDKCSGILASSISSMEPKKGSTTQEKEGDVSFQKKGKMGFVRSVRRERFHLHLQLFLQ